MLNDDEVNNELWQEFHEMLETTLCDENNSNKDDSNGLTESQAKTLIEKFNNVQRSVHVQLQPSKMLLVVIF